MIKDDYNNYDEYLRHAIRDYIKTLSNMRDKFNPQDIAYSVYTFCIDLAIGMLK